MSAGRGRGRGRGRGSSKPPDAIANTAKELGLNPLAFNFGKVEAPPPTYPEIKLPAFGWDEADAFLVTKHRTLQEYMEVSPARIVPDQAVTKRLDRYSDKYRNGEEDEGLTIQQFLGPHLETALFPNEAVHNSLVRSREQQIPIPKRRKRQTSFDDSVRELAEKERTAGLKRQDSAEKGEDDEDAEDEHDDEDDVEDFNDYAVNYYESEGDQSDGGDDEGVL